MPNRILRDWTDSEPIDSLTWEEEVFFTRLIMKVDDFGRFSANPKLLNSLLFPLKSNISNAKITGILSSLISKGLILAYENKGKLFLELVKFGNTPRAKTSKFPAPCVHLHANDFILRANAPVTVTVTETKTETESTSPDGEAFARFWNEYPNKVGKQGAIKAWNKAKPPIHDVLLAIAAQKAWRENAAPGEFIPVWKNPETWLSKGCWMDELSLADEPIDEWAGIPRS